MPGPKPMGTHGCVARQQGSWQPSKGNGLCLALGWLLGAPLRTRTVHNLPGKTCSECATGYFIQTGTPGTKDVTCGERASAQHEGRQAAAPSHTRARLPPRTATSSHERGCRAPHLVPTYASPSSIQRSLPLRSRAANVLSQRDRLLRHRSEPAHLQLQAGLHWVHLLHMRPRLLQRLWWRLR